MHPDASEFQLIMFFLFCISLFCFLGYEPRVRRLATQVVKARSTRSQSAFFAYFAIYHEFAAHNNWPNVGGKSYRITLAIVTYFETAEHVIQVVERVYPELQRQATAVLREATYVDCTTDVFCVKKGNEPCYFWTSKVGNLA